ncbi:MAG: diguanylate cyclase domain-containing protein [Pseudolabrys sp.]
MIAVAAFAVSTYFSLFETLVQLTAHHRLWRELDVAFALFLCAGSWLLFFMLRRSQELRAEIVRRKRAEAEAHNAARRDPLTLLPNRLSFSEAVDSALRVASQDLRLAVFFIDLDGFKPINDTFGHHTGDAVLVEVAKRLNTALTGARHVARLGGDEFGVLVEFCGTDETLKSMIHVIQSSLREPIRVKDIMVRVDATIGFSTGPQEDFSAEDIIRAADHAMYDAKRMRSVTAGYKAA